MEFKKILEQNPPKLSMFHGGNDGIKFLWKCENDDNAFKAKNLILSNETAVVVKW